MMKNPSNECKNGYAASIKPLPVVFNIPLIFAILPACFPFMVFTQDFVKGLNSIFQDAIEQISRENRQPRIIYMIYQAGYCKVRVSDVYTKNWIIDKISSMIYNDMPLMVRSLSRIPKCIFSAMIPGEVLSDQTMLTRINHQNKDINTKLWKILIKRQVMNEFLILIEVDAVNANLIESMSGVVSFGQLPLQLGLLHITNL